MKIGVLALQGGFQEHIHHINELGYDGVLVKTVEDLKNIKALIIPGGESTTMGKLLKVTGLLSPLNLVFIRAPYVSEVNNSVVVLAKVNNNIVAVRENNMLATSFHPELTSNTSFHKYFLKAIAGL